MKDKAEKELENIFNLSSDLICVCTPEGKFTKVNPACERVLGYTKDELLNLGWAKLVHPDDAEKTNKEVEKQLKGNSTTNFINRFKCKDGTYKTLEWQASPSINGTVYASARDTTERRLIERQLKESENKYKQLVSTSPDAIMLFDADTKQFIDINKTCEHLYGYSREEFLELKHDDITNEFEESKSSINEAINGKIKRIPLRYHKKKDGTVFPVEISVSHFKMRDQSVLCGIVRDITDRKQTEDALRDSEERLRKLNDATFEGIAITEGGKIIVVNPQFAKMFGYSMSEIIGKSVADFVAPEHIDLVLQHIKEGYPDAYEHAGLKKDGSRINFEVRGRQILYQGRQARETVLRDITDRKQAEEEKETLNIISQLFLFSENLDFIYDELPKILSNRFRYPIVAIELYDKIAREMIFVGSEGIPRKDSGSMRVPVDQTISGTVATTGEAVVEINAGQRKEYQYAILRKLNVETFLCVPMKIRENVIGTLALANPAKLQDVFTLNDTIQVIANHLAMEIERKKAEEALLREKVKLKTYLDTSAVMVVILDTTGKVNLINKKGCEMLGYREEEIIGKNWFDNFLPERLRNEVKIVFSKLIKGEIKLVEYYENEVLTKSGEERLIAWYNAVLKDEKGNITSGLSSGADITERKKTEEELRKIQKLESIGVLAGGIAHDFNNLLSALRNNVYLSKMNIDHENNAYKNLESAEKIIDRATNLTHQLLTFSRGGAPVKKTASIIDIIEESTEFALKGSSIKCEYKIADNLSNVEVDVGQMNQVIHNLTLNAVQSMPEGGIIKVATENSQVNSDTGLPLQEGNYVKIAIQDKGTGISEEHQKKIFDPYFSTKEAGRGLGLSVVYSIIKKHDGYISAESELGVGTTFTIYLPASEKQIEEKETIEDTFTSGEGKVLIMDDEESVRESFGQLLTQNGYEIECAKDGEEAIELYKKAMEESKPFDAVILDLTIRGGMGGKETIRKLYEIDPNVKAIVASGYSNNPVLANFEAYGFRGVFAKRDRAEELGKVLNKVIKGQQ